jgi:hypothetical protein
VTACIAGWATSSNSRAFLVSEGLDQLYLLVIEWLYNSPVADSAFEHCVENRLQLASANSI